MTYPFLTRLELTRAGQNPACIARLPSGWAVLCDMQFLRGYTILLADPATESINTLDEAGRALFLRDMSMVGDALLEATGAYRINYAIAGNSDPYLHAHIVPRYQDEPEVYRKGLPWSYPQEQIDAQCFDHARDADLIRQIAAALRKRL
jgi:diadenosine tetraphosphate (Ap4A) HIT family hydrolase